MLPAADKGRFAVTKTASDEYVFRAAPLRNVASIVEVASRDHLLKLQGHNAAKRFREALERRLAGSPEQNTSEIE